MNAEIMEKFNSILTFVCDADVKLTTANNIRIIGDKDEITVSKDDFIIQPFDEAYELPKRMRVFVKDNQEIEHRIGIVKTIEKID